MECTLDPSRFPDSLKSYLYVRSKNYYTEVFCVKDIPSEILADLYLSSVLKEHQASQKQNMNNFFQPAASPSSAFFKFIDQTYNSLSIEFREFLTEKTQSARDAHKLQPDCEDYWTDIMTNSDKVDFFKAFKAKVTSESNYFRRI